MFLLSSATPSQTRCVASVESFYLLSFTLYINETTVYTLFRKGFEANKGFLIGQVNQRWKDSNPQTSGYEATTLITWSLPECLPMMGTGMKIHHSRTSVNPLTDDVKEIKS